MAQKNTEGITDEENDEVDTYNIWDELKDAENIEATVVPMEI